MGRFLWEKSSWPNFRWYSDALLQPLGRARTAQGRLLGSVKYGLGLEVQAELLVLEGIATSAIEGERLDLKSVRSSVARQLGLPTAGLPPTERHVDGLVEMLLDATHGHNRPLTAERLFAWQAALFPTGYSGLIKITVGAWRRGSEPMQVVSGAVGKERGHFQAPPAERLETEMENFLTWLNSPNKAMDGFIRAGLAHLWFVTIHPFEDGNGRVARAIADMALAQDEGISDRLYSMSSQIQQDRNAYYEVLEDTQRGDGDITEWLKWFLDCLERAVQRSESRMALVLDKARFWHVHSEKALNERQRKVITRLLEAGPDGFEGSLTNRKYKNLTKVSRETAKRDLTDLVNKGILKRNPGSGRGASYDLAWQWDTENQ